MSLRFVETAFPSGKGQIQITSPQDDKYNCIAWAANDQANKWWPMYPGYWPAGIPRETTLAAFKLAYGVLGYKECRDGSHELGVEKIAIYVNAAGTPTHAARQRSDGSWTSKLGDEWDISHESCGNLEGAIYGTVAAYASRPIPSAKNKEESQLAAPQSLRGRHGLRKV
jgi:hypothetical protein